MKIRIILLSIMILISAQLFSEDYPPENWNPSFVDSLEQAAKEDKYILLNFTGSDWCSWCKKLWSEVFSTEEYTSWAEENAVQVFLDFPSSFKLPENQVAQNTYLQQFLGVKGYPSIWLLDNDLTPLLITGYKDGGAESYISHLENDRLDVEADQIEQFKLQFKQFSKEYLEPLNIQ